MKQKPQAEQPETGPSFEEAMARLVQIADEMDEGGLSLADLHKRFEEGMQLAKLCEAQLSEVERRVELLLEQEDGSVEREPFEEEEDEVS